MATYCQLHGIVIMCAAGIIPELNTDIREAEVVVVKLVPSNGRTRRR